MAPTSISGLHHLTAIATDPQANVDFYVGVLGLRLVKRTVNFDDPSAYHLYYGDAAGSPGSILTFFSWPEARRGRVGGGQITRISLSVPPASLDFWRARLTAAGITAERAIRFGEEVLAFRDPDGIPVELVALADDARLGWAGTNVPVEHAVRGMHTVELTVADPAPTEQLLTALMGYRLLRREGDRARFAVAEARSGQFVDVIRQTAEARAMGGAGTIHHIAFRVADDAAEQAMQERLREAGFRVSPVMDRSYFRSVYYREAGGILFEIATDVPGFAIDEAPEALGTALKLPPQYEAARAEIERALPPVVLTP
ncbi:ring-cleaving dioxygenase [Opitutus sp. ER46]|uniref:ring-cleaving dioxygenase n=1 Tax=Opitutus sp. ER46 TaxID=2161864 RepID=UPI001E4EA5CA|nr:ring-cleaving dioxygenase [Opitutus sp. ER46]